MLQELKLTVIRDLISAVYKRIDFFNEVGSRVSDHALDSVPFEDVSDEEVEAIFKKAMNGEKTDPV